ncbi:acetyl-CoA carboxylase biotin carboxylase subunit [Aestuariispira insulae]|uniref:Biotin carboxyl carrier protein /biotin carboxylase n=1 Tax=Aestuariispira insulae TaxID=1461337 RepID=A0A3D9HSQ4_9PROT|nr:acetyl/propionyl/methylcrotonyl-CoA carboxylase subunit alpha [Aestuariispira insulae]RED52517.1 biotin carboxyl carrier protein /biotin carboxylase [Aestuariispira insulae]
MFKKILIANRGEIACRVIKTARKMGIATVAIYSEADADALHVKMADEAVCVGPAPSAESYLVIDNILAAIRQTGAEAVHPGYGFLSENRHFAAALKKEGVAFIGPPEGAIQAMGDKIESKKIAEAAGVNTVPGHLKAVSDPEEAVQISNDIGYPVMLKASAGGGGKGMRLAWNDDEAREGLVSAMNEGRNSFGDDRVFIEKFIEEPRHIEIQVMADSHGNAIYLGERECSIQRRHQKVLEEAPSPFLDEETRAAMGEQAVQLAKQVDYCSAGTVEFIVDKDRNFYFLEMNTRLQVEHPVTELVTGQDLVELMIRVADGEKLPLAQKDVTLTGWALEARLYAEDPERGFLPSTGRLVDYLPPEEKDNEVRVDTGVVEGAEISMFYDPMIAKLITYGDSREQAIDNMREALDRYYVRGLSTNLAFLAQLCRHERFRSGAMTTNFIAEEYPDGLTPELLVPEDPKLFAAIAAVIQSRVDEEDGNISGRITPAAPLRATEYSAFLGDQDRPELELVVNRVEDRDRIEVEGRVIEVSSGWKPGEGLFRGLVDDRKVVMQIDRHDSGVILTHDGARTRVQVVPKRLAHLVRLMPYKAPPDMSKFLISPMPGLLVKLSVAEGDQVKAGAELAVIEAMKMENVMRASQDCVVTKLHANTGESLVVDQKIIEFE